MNNILREFLDISIIVYLNDILVFSKEEKQYIEYIQQVLATLQKGGMLLKQEKYKFYIKKVEFLRYIIILEGIRIDPAKVSTILS